MGIELKNLKVEIISKCRSKTEVRFFVQISRSETEVRFFVQISRSETEVNHLFCDRHTHRQTDRQTDTQTRLYTSLAFGGK